VPVTFWRQQVQRYCFGGVPLKGVERLQERVFFLSIPWTCERVTFGVVTVPKSSARDVLNIRGRFATRLSRDHYLARRKHARSGFQTFLSVSLRGACCRWKVTASGMRPHCGVPCGARRPRGTGHRIPGGVAWTWTMDSPLWELEVSDAVGDWRNWGLPFLLSVPRLLVCMDTRA
jgi:hypothetical protein